MGSSLVVCRNVATDEGRSRIRPPGRQAARQGAGGDSGSEQRRRRSRHGHGCRAVDYPDKARELGEAIRSGAAERGVLVCGSGVGASIAACKLPGIRAAICHDAYSAHQGVEHDDMNVLCLGSEVVGAELAAELVRGIPRCEVRRRRALRDETEEGGSDGKVGTWLRSKLHELSEQDQSVWIDSISREWLEDGLLEKLMREDAVVGVTSNPTIFQKSLVRGQLVRRATDARCCARRTIRRRSSTGSPCEDIQARVRHAAHGLGRGRRRGRLRLDGGRSDARLRARGDDRGGPAPARVDRPPEPAS